jgi:hypothetical protein
MIDYHLAGVLGAVIVVVVGKAIGGGTKNHRAEDLVVKSDQ